MKKLIITAVLAFVTAGAWAQKTAAPAAKQATQEKGVITFDYLKYNMGNLNEKGGMVSHTFDFTNTGKGPIRIVNVATSCGCTSSQWTKTEVLPGEKGTVKAVYDPNGRQGEFNKQLTIETTGDPTYITITISGRVFPSLVNFNNTYLYQYGHLAIKTNTINFPAIKNTGYDSVEIGFFNMSNKKIYLFKIEAANNMVFTKPYDHIPPNADVKVKLRYYPRRPVEYGPVRQEIKFQTNDDSLPVKVFSVTANIVEDFGSLDKKALKKAPKALFNKTSINLGQVHYTDTPYATFTITNKGKQDLIIRRVVQSCGCLVPEIAQQVIPKGKSTTLIARYSLNNIVGPDSKTLKVITNDPLQPETTLTVTIDVIP